MYSSQSMPGFLKIGSLALILGALLLLAACGESGSHAVRANVPQVRINESDFQISASLTTFVPGGSYHFVIQNNGHIEHELMLMPANVDTTNGMSMARMDQMALFEVTHLAPGLTRSLDYTFPESTMGAHLQFACHYAGHYQAGMSLNVTVSARFPNA